MTQTTNVNNLNNTNKLSEALDSYMRGCIKTEFNRNEYGKLFMRYLKEHLIYKKEI